MIFARSSFGKCRPDADIAKARRGCAMSGSHRLHRLALPAIWRAPQRPRVAIADRIAGVPELRGDSAVAWILQHPGFLAALDLPSDLRGKLKLIAAIVDGP